MSLVDRTTRGGVAVVTMDDGKANALSPSLLDAVGAALDQAEADEVTAVVLAGRPGRFSGGFDLGVLQAGGPEAARMLRGGFRLAERLLRSPRPVVVGCTGHSLAMGSFLLCSGDHRVGAAGDFRIQANEVAIGLTMPFAALAILRHRLTTPAFDQAAVVAARFSPESAVRAGFLDEVVPADDVVPRAEEVARSLGDLDPAAHLATKLRARATLLDELGASIADELGAG